MVRQSSVTEVKWRLQHALVHTHTHTHTLTCTQSKFLVQAITITTNNYRWILWSKHSVIKSYWLMTVIVCQGWTIGGSFGYQAVGSPCGGKTLKGDHRLTSAVSLHVRCTTSKTGLEHPLVEIMSRNTGDIYMHLVWLCQGMITNTRCLYVIGMLSRWCINVLTDDQSWTADTWAELDRAVQGHQSSSRTSIFSFVWGGTGGALPQSYKMTPSRLLVCMFMTKLSETDSMKVAWGAKVL